MADNLYTLEEWQKDKLLIAKAISQGKYDMAYDFLNGLYMVANFKKEYMSGMLLVLGILKGDG